MCFPVIRRGRFARIMSFLVKHSSAAEGEDTTTTRRDPKRSENIGPSFLERPSKVLWNKGLPMRRCRWPNNGNFILGLGGKRCVFDLR